MKVVYPHRRTELSYKYNDASALEIQQSREIQKKRYALSTRIGLNGRDRKGRVITDDESFKFPF